MLQLRRSPDYGTTPDAAAYNTVFIDTSLDTHLALLLTDSDTVSHFKDKIVLEHGHCFPEIGLLKIHALKVKRKGSFYHLPDYMFVKSAFEGINKSWFLYVDVSKCNDVTEILEHGASDQRDILTTSLHDQDDLRDASFKIPRAVHKLEVADVQNGSSLKPKCNIPASSQEFKDDNVPDDVRNLGSYSSGQSVETCNFSAKKLKRKRDSLQATSASKENEMLSQVLHSNKSHFETGNTAVNTQNNEANTLLGSHVESEPHRDGQELSSSNVKKSKPNRKDSLHIHEQAHSSLSLAKRAEVNECTKQNVESEKGCASFGKDNMTTPASFCSPSVPNSTHNDMQKMDHMDKTVETNLLALHNPELDCTGELNPSQDGLGKPGESTLRSTLSDTKEVNVHNRNSKKRTKRSKSKRGDAHAEQVKNLTTDSHLPDTNGQELPESPESRKGKIFSENDDVTEPGHLGSLDIHHSLHGDMLIVDNINKTEERNLLAAYDPEMRQTEERELLHCKSTIPSAFLITKEVKTHESSQKKRSKLSRSGVQDEHVDRSTDSTADFGVLLPNVASSDHQSCENGTDEATEGLTRGHKRNKKKVKMSGAAIKDQRNRESIATEKDLNLKQVPETDLPDNLECPDVLKDFDANEATRDGKAIGEKKEKQEVEKAVARVQETVDMNPEADQINDIVSPSLHGPDSGKNLNHGGKKKKKKVKMSGAAVKDQRIRDSISAENDLNLKQIPETDLPDKAECPDVLKAFDVNEETRDGTAIGEKKEKQGVEMNQDADQMNDIVSPSLNSPEIHQKLEGRDLLVNNNLEGMVLSGDRPSNRDRNEPVTEAFSNANTSTAIVADQQKISDTGMKRRSKKTVSGVYQDGMDTENTQTHTRPASSDLDWHVEKDKDFSPVPKGIEASARGSSDTSRAKNTPPLETHRNEVSAESKTQKDGEVSECIGKEINFKQYFVPTHQQDEVTRESSAGTVAKKKRTEVVPSAVSVHQPQQDFPKSSKKDSIISSAGKANTLTESYRVTKNKKKSGKRGVPYATTSSDLDEIRTPQKPRPSAFLNDADATKTVPRRKETIKPLAPSRVNLSSKTPLKSNTRDRKVSSSVHHVTASKVDKEVVNKSKQRKSLGHTPKGIFRDVSSESSLDENGSVDSTASTRTPSDNLSSSSDLSDGRDDNDKGGSKKSISNSVSSGPRDIPLDEIFKSSSRFKKAKLTASQQFEDPDSQFGDLLAET